MKEELMWKAERMLHERWLYHTMKRNFDTAHAYQNACDILVAAMTNNEEVLRQFDYYHDKVKVVD